MVLRQTFLKDVCCVPAEELDEASSWGLWRNSAGWTVLRLTAEYLQQMRAPEGGWLDAIRLEDFIKLFHNRGGDVDALVHGTPGGLGYGSSALQMVANQPPCPDAARERDVVRFVKALIVEGKASINLHTRTEHGRPALALAIMSGHLDLLVCSCSTGPGVKPKIMLATRCGKFASSTMPMYARSCYIS